LVKYDEIDDKGRRNFCAYCGSPLKTIKKKYGKKISYFRPKVFCNYECHQDAVAEHHSSKKGKTYEEIYIKRNVKFADIFLPKKKTHKDIKKIKDKCSLSCKKYDYPKKLMDQIKKLYKKGFSIKYIAKKFKLCQQTINRKLDQMGLLRKDLYKNYDLKFVPKIGGK
jgi:hypothetical protein